MKDVTSVRFLQAPLFTIAISIVVWIPIETSYLLREARLVSHIIEEDSLTFVTRMRGELSGAENIAETIDGNLDLFNMYRATIDDKITVMGEENELGTENTVAETIFDYSYKPQRTAVQKAIIKRLAAIETTFYNKEPVTYDVNVSTFKKGDIYYYKMSTIFNNGGNTYTVSLQRNLNQVYSRYLNLEIEAVGQMLVIIILVTTVAGGVLIYYFAGHFRDTIVKQAEAVSLSHENAPNLGEKQGPHIKEASDAVILLGKRLAEVNERSVNALYDVSYYVSSHLAEIKQAIDLIQY